MRIAPGQACQLTTDVLIDLIWDMTPAELRILVGDLAAGAPEAFAEAMLDKARDPARFADQIARRRRHHAREAMR